MRVPHSFSQKRLAPCSVPAIHPQNIQPRSFLSFSVTQLMSTSSPILTYKLVHEVLQIETWHTDISCNPISFVSATGDPGLICPEDIHPVFISPVFVGFSPFQTLSSIISDKNGFLTVENAGILFSLVRSLSQIHLLPNVGRAQKQILAKTSDGLREMLL